MKLKGLGNRAYNVLFHTHTVAGIVISFALFIIFYAGAFALFRHEVYQWENHTVRGNTLPEYDYDKAYQLVDSHYELDALSNTTLVFPNANSPVLKVYGTTHLADSSHKRVAATVLPGSYNLEDMGAPKTTVGDTLYHLHYFGQISKVGIYIRVRGLVFLVCLHHRATHTLAQFVYQIFRLYHRGWLETGMDKRPHCFGRCGVALSIHVRCHGRFFLVC